MFIDKNEMLANKYIATTRAYLDYVEEHIENIRIAFDELSRACDGKMHWVGDDCAWFTMRADVRTHDLSKFSKEEFVQYRDHFYPVSEKDKENSHFAEAWENHKQCNHHHHETVGNFHDVYHMVIDWVAMSYKFGDNPRDFYEKTKPKMGGNITGEMHQEINLMFDCLEAYRHQRKSILERVFCKLKGSK